MVEFRMPSLGADMDEGRVVEWKIKPGDHVERGDVVAVVDTDKADIDVEIFERGVVEAIVVPEGERVPVGTVLATLRADGAAPVTAAPAPVLEGPPPVPPPVPVPEPPAPPSPERPAPPEPPLPPSPEPPAPQPPPLPEPPAPEPPPGPEPPVPAGTPADDGAASPVVRRLARHLGVDLRTVAGTGPGSRITRADVERAATRGGARPPEVPVAVVVPAPERAVGSGRQASMRQSIAALMSRSKREIPHYYLETQIDLGAATAWLADRNASRPVTERILPAVLLLKAVARAAATVSRVNGFWIDDGFVASPAVHLGVAVALRDGGLIAPAIHDADRLTVEELMVQLRDLVGRVRAGRLRSSEMSDPTITVTNLGDQGVEAIHGVIYPPQVALVGFGAIVERPWARDGMLGIRPVVTATLAADHRASDGREGARLLATVDRLLQRPEEL